MPLNTAQLNELRSVATQAVVCEKNTEIPAELTIAQWALESGWGQHQPGNNCFGIKYYVGAPGKQLLVTKENFTKDEVLHWLSKSEGRIANPISYQPDEAGRLPYKCEDYFATFPTLASCF